VDCESILGDFHDGLAGDWIPNIFRWIAQSFGLQHLLFRLLLSLLKYVNIVSDEI
jgi:hypothetical protein